MLICVCIVFLMFSCFDDRKYIGDYPELESIAVNSLLDGRGNDGYGDKIIVIEVDDQGRTLFSYENHGTSYLYENFYSLIICQKSDDKYAYYYPDYNFIITETKSEMTDEKIEEIKEKNDWNKEINDEKMIKTKVKRIKDDYTFKTMRINEFRDMIFEVFKKKNDNYGQICSITYFLSDAYDRHIFLVIIEAKNEESVSLSWKEQYIGSYVVMINSDEIFDKDNGIMELVNHYNYQDQLKAFKDANNWDKPLE